MALSVEERIAQLEASVADVLPTDTMAEAGRKVLLGEFVRMLEHEGGSRTGEDVEDVHDMRVAIRRMRSAFRLLSPYYKPKAVRPYTKALRRLGWALGDVRDLDVLIVSLQTFQRKLKGARRSEFGATIDILREKQATAREDLVAALDSKGYRRFLKTFSEFLTTPATPIEHHQQKIKGEVTPSQVRHLLASMIYDRLAAVRAYEDVVAEADAATLHALRIEFKRLRYTVSLFEVVLGSTISEFIDDLKSIQDTLGKISDAATARARLNALLEDGEEGHSDALDAYLEQLEGEQKRLIDQFKTQWEHFNSRKVQEKLSKAVLALR